MTITPIEFEVEAEDVGRTLACAAALESEIVAATTARPVTIARIRRFITFDNRRSAQPSFENQQARGLILKELSEARGARLETFLHQNGAQPSAELEANLAKVPLVFKAKTFVKCNRGLGPLVTDYRDDFFDSGGFRLGKKSL